MGLEDARLAPVPDGAGSAADASGCGGNACAVSAAEGFTSRLERIWGAAGLARLAASTVMVLGIGGVGSNCAEALVRGGVGRVIVVDGDAVQESNINRQAVAFRSTVGRAKVDVMRDMAADINPQCQVIALRRFLLPADVPALFGTWGAGLAYVVDAIDTVSTKLAVAEYADVHGLRLISSMGAANKLHPEKFAFADISETANCPLCRVMRKEARKRGIRCLRVLYSNEEPVRVATRAGAARSERSNLGTASFVPPIMGQMIAGEVIRNIVALDAADGPAGSGACGGSACAPRAQERR